MLTLAFNPPDGLLEEIIIDYLKEHEALNLDASIACLARHSLLQTTRRKQAFHRSRLPSAKELEAIRVRKKSHSFLNFFFLVINFVENGIFL
jgi:hypothetical protein